jgi:alpha-1,2-mannosyltransferase
VSIGARRALQGLLVASVVIGMCLLVFDVSPRAVWHHTFDLRVYRGAVRWWLDGRRVYDFVRPHTQKGFTYPPFAVLVLLPVALGTDRSATVLLTTVSIGLLVLTTWWLVVPVADRHGWARWMALGIALAVAVAMEPVRETLGWGQIDLVVAALVLADVGWLSRRHPWAGVGIGLASAIKVTPGLFLVYLVVTRRWRAAAVAAGTFVCTVLVGGAVDPSVRYWTRVLWETGRVGPPTDPNNQSLLGLLSRLAAPGAPRAGLWLALTGLVLIVGITRAALLHRRGDDLAGVTVTGLTACLISPISWVHHLYWVVPAVVLLVDVAAGTPVAASSMRQHAGAVRIIAAVAALIVAGAFGCSLVWFFVGLPPGPLTVVGVNAYVLLLLVLVLALPARDTERPGLQSVGSQRERRPQQGLSVSASSRSGPSRRRRSSDGDSPADRRGAARACVVVGPDVVLPDSQRGSCWRVLVLAPAGRVPRGPGSRPCIGALESDDRGHRRPRYTAPHRQKGGRRVGAVLVGPGRGRAARGRSPARESQTLSPRRRAALPALLVEFAPRVAEGPRPGLAVEAFSRTSSTTAAWPQQGAAQVLCSCVWER